MDLKKAREVCKCGAMRFMHVGEEGHNMTTPGELRDNEVCSVFRFLQGAPTPAPVMTSSAWKDYALGRNGYALQNG